MDNLEEMGKFLGKYSLSGLNQEEIWNTNRQIISTKIETMILKFPTKESPGSDGFIGEFYQTFREELTPILSEIIPENHRKEHSQTHSIRSPPFW